MSAWLLGATIIVVAAISFKPATAFPYGISIAENGFSCSRVENIPISQLSGEPNKRLPLSNRCGILFRKPHTYTKSVIDQLRQTADCVCIGGRVEGICGDHYISMANTHRLGQIRGVTTYCQNTIEVAYYGGSFPVVGKSIQDKSTRILTAHIRSDDIGGIGINLKVEIGSLQDWQYLSSFARNLDAPLQMDSLPHRYASENQSEQCQRCRKCSDRIGLEPIPPAFLSFLMAAFWLGIACILQWQGWRGWYNDRRLRCGVFLASGVGCSGIAFLALFVNWWFAGRLLLCLIDI